MLTRSARRLIASLGAGSQIRINYPASRPGPVPATESGGSASHDHPTSPDSSGMVQAGQSSCPTQSYDTKLMSRTWKRGRLPRPLFAISNLTPISLLRQRLTLSLPSSLTNLNDFLHLPARRHLAAHQLLVPAVQTLCSWAGYETRSIKWKPPMSHYRFLRTIMIKIRRRVVEEVDLALLDLCRSCLVVVYTV